MIDVICSNAEHHQPKEPITYSIQPFEKEQVVCEECGWVMTAEGELERKFRLIKQDPTTAGEWHSEVEDYSKWLVLQCLKRNDKEQSLDGLAAKTQHDDKHIWDGDLIDQIKPHIYDWVFTEQFRKALLTYADYDVDHRQYIVKLIPFNLITEDGTELQQDKQSGSFQIGDGYHIDGRWWTTVDVLEPFPITEDRWTIIVKPRKIPV